MATVNDIVTVNNVTSEQGYFTVTGTNATGVNITVTISFQEYILLFSNTNMDGIDNAVSAMVDNTQYFAVALEEISNAVSGINICIGYLKDPDDRMHAKDGFGNRYPAWVEFVKKYQNVVILTPFYYKPSDNGTNRNAKLSEYRAVLDNLNEFQTTLTNKSEQWNTRTGAIVSAKTTAVDLAKTLLGYIKDALFATNIR